MSKRSQEKRQARSKEKKHARHRMLGASPLSRLAGTAEDTCECWMGCSSDQRMISLHVMRPVRGGQTVGAFFLIDRDCIGLKDAFYRLEIDPVGLRETLRQRSQADGMRMVKMDLAELRQLVASAMRWTRAHPFRMPADAERCVKIIGGAGDIEHADIGDFGDEDGNLLYVGRQVDLVRRLQGLTLEEFMDREDVECVFHQGDESFDDDGEYAEDLDENDDETLLASDDFDDADDDVIDAEMLAMRERLKHNMLDAVRRWCFSMAVAPHPELEAAVDLTIVASMEGLGDENEMVATERALRSMKTLSSFENPEKQAELAAAQAQLKEFANSFPSREAYLNAINQFGSNA